MLRRDGEGGLFGLLCSRNARPRKVLVGRAQWETKQATLPEETTSKPGEIMDPDKVSGAHIRQFHLLAFLPQF
jgi:hypothetical protein